MAKGLSDAIAAFSSAGGQSSRWRLLAFGLGILAIASACAFWAGALVHRQFASRPPEPVGINPVVPDQDSYVFDTAEVHGIKVTVIARDLGRPFAIEFLPDGDLLLAERGGDLRIIRGTTSADPALDPQPAGSMEPLEEFRNLVFGLHDIAIDPNFESNRLIYWTWNEPTPTSEDSEGTISQGHLQIRRGRLTSTGLSDIETIFSNAGEYPPFASRIQFDAAGLLWAATAAPYYKTAQDRTSPLGKVLRLRADGSIPPDNPFVDDADWHPAVYSLGHRDQQGMAFHPGTGDLFTTEHGPNGGDELNLIRSGANYGWPDYTWGREYDGSVMREAKQGDGITDPLVAWLPSIAPSGLMFYTGDAFPAWQGNLFAGSLRRGEIDSTGGLERIVFSEEFGELRRENLLSQMHQRVRDVVQGPDGLIYVLTEGIDPVVLRIAPSE